MRDLQPWESEGGLEVSLEDGDKASVSIDLQGAKWTPDVIWNKMLFTIYIKQHKTQSSKNSVVLTMTKSQDIVCKSWLEWMN